MNQINFEKHNPATVEIGQIRRSQSETVLIVIAEQTEDSEEEYRFNAIVLDGGLIYNTLYTKPQSALEIEFNHPKLINVHEIKIITKEDV